MEALQKQLRILEHLVRARAISVWMGVPIPLLLFVGWHNLLIWWIVGWLMLMLSCHAGVCRQRALIDHVMQDPLVQQLLKSTTKRKG